MNLSPSPYRTVWIFLFFDLPTVTKAEKKKAASFRTSLEKEGFQMFQYSVYIQFCGSRQAAELKLKKIRKLVPGPGRVSILLVTDKQYGQIINIWNSERVKLKSPEMLTLFK